MKRGYFAAQPIDPNNTGLNNLLREAARGLWSWGYNLPQNTDLTMTRKVAEAEKRGIRAGTNAMIGAAREKYPGLSDDDILSMNALDIRAGEVGGIIMNDTVNAIDSAAVRDARIEIAKKDHNGIMPETKGKKDWRFVPLSDAARTEFLSRKMEILKETDPKEYERLQKAQDELSDIENQRQDLLLSRAKVEFFAAQEKNLAASQNELFKQIDKHNAYIESKLGMNRGTFMGDLGGAVGSLAVFVGASVVAGPYGATAAAVGQGLNTSGNNYRELIEAGIDPTEAYHRAIATGMTEAVLERIGIGLMFDSAGKKILQRVMIGFITEASEEFTQNLTEDLIMNKVRGKSVGEILIDAGYAGLLGGITGAGAGSVAGGASLNPTMRARYVKELTDRGVPKAQAEQLIDKVAEQFNKKNVVQEFNSVIQEQTRDDQYPDGDFGKAFDVMTTVAKDKIDAVRAEIDIRDEVKSRALAGGIDETTANFTADLAQDWADGMAREFGIPQREVLENTGLAFNNESAALTENTSEKITRLANLRNVDLKIAEHVAESLIDESTIPVGFDKGDARDAIYDELHTLAGTKDKPFFEKTSPIRQWAAKLLTNESMDDSLNKIMDKTKEINQLQNQKEMEPRLNNNGELVAADGKVLFQRAPATDTAEFKNWFGDSKVVDETGKPMIVYHGTDATFDTFDDKFFKVGVTGKGFYFTDSNESGGGFGQNVMPVYLSLQNPLDFSKVDYETVLGMVRAEMMDMNPQEFQDLVKSKGFDGIINYGHYVAFEPNQIKSVDNRGAFDPKNPNIYYQWAENNFAPTEHELKTFARDLDEAIYSEPGKDVKIRVFQRLPEMYQEIGIKDAPVKTDKKTILKDTIEKHKVSMDVAQRLPELMADPIMVMESMSTPGRYVVVLNAKDANGDTMVAALSPSNRDGGYHFIPSFYGKDNLDGMIRRALDVNKVKYVKNKESLLTGPNAYLSQGITGSILEKGDIVKRFYQNEQRVRGYLDWTNLGQQLLAILKSGDRDTVVHELAHFFTINYTNMAIQTGKTENLKAIMDYYNVSDPAALMRLTRIQEDLARKFLTYIKTDESPRGFRKYFDEMKDWLTQMWEKLESMGLVHKGELDTEIVEFFDTITNARIGAVNLETIQRQKDEIKQLLKDIKAGKNVRIGNIDLNEVEDLINSFTNSYWFVDLGLSRREMTVTYSSRDFEIDGITDIINATTPYFGMGTEIMFGEKMSLSIDANATSFLSKFGKLGMSFLIKYYF
ncbi:MAG: hypothetical protein FWG80_04455 [Alphaproteobacteria bacterium]|nr:hypothetical protein [Alphaproteobacteria bacterium]